MSIAPLTADAIRHTCRVKIFPDGTADVLIASRAIFRESGWEERQTYPAETPETPETPDPEAEDAIPSCGPERAMRRARAAVRDIARANRFAYFVTLTLDAAKVDRYDMAAITKKLNNWLDNRVRRNGLAYVLVPERHKDGAIHFHGFFNDALPVVDSGHKDRAGHRVYNLPAWPLGFSTAIELYGDYQSAVAYVCKYIGKQGEKPGGRWYYSGGDLKRPEVYLCDADPAEMPGQGYTFPVPDVPGLTLTIWTLPPIEQMFDNGPVREQTPAQNCDMTIFGKSFAPQTPAPTGLAAAPPGE